MTEYNADKAQENAAREEATHEESMHNKTTQEKSAQEVTASEQRKAEEEALKKAPRPASHPPRTQIPLAPLGNPRPRRNRRGIGAILIPVMVGQFINQHIAGKAPTPGPCSGWSSQPSPSS